MNNDRSAPTVPRDWGALRPIALALCLGSVLCGCGPAEEPPPEAASGEQALLTAAEAEATASKARLSMSREELRFQERCPGASGRKTLSLKNDGTGTLIINGLSIEGRSFSLVDAPRLPRRIPSGERLELAVKYSPPADRPDLLLFKGTLRIISNDSNSKTASVALRGTVPPMNLAFFPMQLDLGAMSMGQARTGWVQLQNAGACPLTVGGFDVSGDMEDSILVDDIDQFQLLPGNTRRLKITGLCDRRGEIDASIRFFTPSNVRLGKFAVLGRCG